MKTPAQVQAFIADLRKFCQERGFSIGHEDGHGSFEIELWHPDFDQWLAEARDRVSNDRFGNPITHSKES